MTTDRGSARAFAEVVAIHHALQQLRARSGKPNYGVSVKQGLYQFMSVTYNASGKSRVRKLAPPTTAREVVKIINGTK